MTKLILSTMLGIHACIKVSATDIPVHEKFYYLEGTLREKAIVMKISLYDETGTGKYFYRDEKKDIVLHGEGDSARCVLSMTKWDPVKEETVVLEKFTLSETTEHTWQGEWVGPDKKVYPVILRPIKRESVKHAFAYLSVVNDFDTYSYVRSADIGFSKVRTQQIGNYSVDWLEEHLSGITFFRIQNGFSEKKKMSSNIALENFHVQAVEGYFSCNSVARAGQYSMDIEITFLNNDLISFLYAISSNCYGVELLAELKSHTMSVETGSKLMLEHIFWLGTGSPPVSETDTWNEYRINVFGNVIATILRKLYPERMKSLNSCDYSNPEIWQFPSWHLTFSGLYLGAFLPGIDRSCDAPEWAVIPYEHLKDFKNPDFNFAE